MISDYVELPVQDSIRRSRIATLIVVFTAIFTCFITLTTITLLSRTSATLELANKQVLLWQRIENVLSVDISLASNPAYAHRNFQSQRERLAVLLDDLDQNIESLLGTIRSRHRIARLSGLSSAPYPIEEDYDNLQRIVAGLRAVNGSIRTDQSLSNTIVDSNFGVVVQSRKQLNSLSQTIERLSDEAGSQNVIATWLNVFFAIKLIFVVFLARRGFVLPAIQQLAQAYTQHAIDMVKLNRQSDLVAGAFLAIVDAAVVFNAKGELVVANSSFKKLTKGSTISDPLNFLLSLMQTKPAYAAGQTPLEKLKGIRHLVETNPSSLVEGKILAWVCTETESADLIFVAHDQTMLRQELEADKHAVRLEALGRVSASVAHDFNNILAGISSRAEMLQLHEDLPSYLSQHMEGFLDSVARGKNITSQLQTYARKRVETEERLSTEELLLRVQKQIFTPPNITLKAENHSRKNIKIPPMQLVTAVENAVKNSVDAIGEEQGEIKITAKDVQFLGQGNWVSISIEDTGGGFSEEALHRGSELFFSTKPPGSGTGVGLSMLEDLMSSLGGRLEISNAATGAKVELFFPSGQAGSPPLRNEERTGPGARPPGEMLGGSLLILEDDPMLGSIQESYLRNYFEHVILCHTVGECLETMAGSENIDFGLFDWNLPDGTSENAIKYFAGRFAKNRILVTSGNLDESLDVLRAQLQLTVLEKPVQMRQLIDELGFLSYPPPEIPTLAVPKFESPDYG
jgi:signal transduction histidine kinase